MTNRVLPAADINVTPLIDVMLVLLIIFMVVTPVSHRAIDTELPSPAASAIRPAGLDAVRGAGAERIGMVRREPPDR